MTEQDYAERVRTLREAAQAMLAWTGEPYVNESCQICGAYEDEGHADCEAAALRAALAAPAPSEPWEPPLDATCPNCGFRFRFSPTDTYRNHRCPAPAPSEPGLASDLYDAIESVLASDHSCRCDMEHLRALWLRDRSLLAAPAPSEPGLDALAFDVLDLLERGKALEARARLREYARLRGGQE